MPRSVLVKLMSAVHIKNLARPSPEASCSPVPCPGVTTVCLISILAGGDKTQDMTDTPMLFLGNVLLLIVGDNDTTRNSIRAGALALNEFPDQFVKLKANHALISNMLAEMVRWQAPLIHMRRTALQDFN